MILSQKRVTVGSSVFRISCAPCSLPLVPTRDSTPESTQQSVWNPSTSRTRRGWSRWRNRTSGETNMGSPQSIQERVKEVNTRTQTTPISYQHTGVVGVAHNELVTLLDKIWDRTARFPLESKCRTCGKCFAWHGSIPSLVTILQNLFPLTTKTLRQSVCPQLAQRSLTNSTPWTCTSTSTLGPPPWVVETDRTFSKQLSVGQVTHSIHDALLLEVDGNDGSPERWALGAYDNITVGLGLVSVMNKSNFAFFGQTRQHVLCDHSNRVSTCLGFIGKQGSTKWILKWTNLVPPTPSKKNVSPTPHKSNLGLTNH